MLVKVLFAVIDTTYSSITIIDYFDNVVFSKTSETVLC